MPKAAFAGARHFESAPRSILRKIHWAVAWAALLAPSGAATQPARPDFWCTNGPVRALARVGDTLYVGGQFGLIGPFTGAAARIDRTSADPDPGFPLVQGKIHALESDGAGGWFVGGEFDTVGTDVRSNLAHIAADGSVTGWNPGANGAVRCLSRVGTTVYAGGSFNQIGGSSRAFVAAIDAGTGAATGWDPGADAFVTAIAAHPNRVYVGGHFLNIGSAARTRLAALDPATGLATGWGPTPNGAPTRLALDGGALFACGPFGSIGGASRAGIAELDTTVGAATSWNAGANGPVLDFQVRGSLVYLAGTFNRVNISTLRAGLAAVSRATALATSWNPATAGSRFLSIATDSATVFAGGRHGPGLPPWRVLAVDSASGSVQPWQPIESDSVLALREDGASVLIGGAFTLASAKIRVGLAAIDIPAGRAIDWNPTPSGAGNIVHVLVSRGPLLYVGGSFTQMGGQARTNLAALDRGSAVATAWTPNPDADVMALAVDGSTVYAGGAFANIGGQPRAFVAAVDATSGAATDWNPGADSYVNALLLHDSAIYAGGSFDVIGGASRVGAAKLDPGSNLAMNWIVDTDGGSPVHALAGVGTRVYLGGGFTSVNGTPRSGLAAVHATSGALEAWNPGVDLGLPFAIAPWQGVVYVGGLMSQVGGLLRDGVAVLDPISGGVRPWNPGAGAVFSIVPAAEGVYIGGSFDRVHGLRRSCLAAVVDPAVTSATMGEAPAARTGIHLSLPSPVRGRAELSFELDRPDRITLEILDLAGRRALVLVANAWHSAGRHRVTLAPGTLASGLYFARLRAGASQLARRLVVIR